MKRVAWSLLGIASIAAAALAADAPPSAGGKSEQALFDAATAALREGRVNDAIADFESMGDQGVVDPVVSYDRGLAYAARVRMSMGAGEEVPGDLGRAAHGFEEARELARAEPSAGDLASDATRALGVIRAEVARRRAQAGDPVEVDPGMPLRRAVMRLVSEEAWALFALFAALVLGASLFVRWLATPRRLRIAAAIAIGVSAPVLAITAAVALYARYDRLHLREGILVAAAVRPADERHIVLDGAAPLPEAARVVLLDDLGGWTHIAWGKVDGWVPSPTVRPIARVP